MRSLKRKMFLSIAAGAAMAGHMHQARANTTYTWTGGAGSAATATTGSWNATASWLGLAIPPINSIDTELNFGGSGAVAYTSNDNISGHFSLNEIQLNSTASVTESITSSFYSLRFNNNTAAAGPQILQNSTGAFIISSNITLNNSLIIGGTGTGSISLGGLIGGSGTGITLSNPNNLVILTGSVANTFSGATLVNAGTLQLTAAAQLTSSSLNLSGGNLQLRNDANTTFATASTIISANTTIDADRISSGTGKTMKLGTISIGANTLNVTGGHSDILSPGGITLTNTAVATTTTILNPTTAPLQITGGATGTAAASSSVNTLDLDGTNSSNSLSGKISDGNGTNLIALSKTNSSTWTLSGTTSNNYGGGTTVSNGILILGKSNATDAIPNGGGGLSITGGTVQLAAVEQIANAAPVAISGSGTFNLAGFTETIKSLTMTGGTVGPTGTLTINSNGAITVNSGTISAGLVTGTGVVTLGSGALISGAVTLNANVDFTGTTTGATLGAGAITLNANRTFNALRGTDLVDLNVSGAISSTALTGTQNINIQGKSGGAGNNGNYSLSGNISDGITGGHIAVIVDDKSANVAFSGANTFTGGATITAGTVLLGSGNSIDNLSGPLGPTAGQVLLGNPTGNSAAKILTSGAFTFANNITLQTGTTGNLNIGGSTDNNSIFSGNITLGTGTTAGQNLNLVSTTTGINTTTISGLIQDPVGLTGTAGFVNIGQGGSTGTVVLANGGSTYTGGTFLNSGALSFGTGTTGSVTSGPIGTGSLSVYNGTAIQASVAGVSIGNKFLIGGQGSTGDIGFTISGSNNFTISGNVVLSKTGINTITDTNAGTTTISGNVNGNGATVNKAGAGTLVFGQSNNYTGSTIVSAGILRETSNNGVPVGSALVVGSGASFQLRGHDATPFSISDLLPSGGGGTVDFGSGANTFTLNGSATTSFSGSFIGATTAASFIQAGGGTLTLSGQSTVLANLVVQGSSHLYLNNTSGRAFTNLISASAATSSTLVLNQSNQLPDAIQISVDSAGTFDTNGNNQTVAGLTLGLGTVQTGLGTLNLAGDISYSLSANNATALTGNIDLTGAVRTIFASNLIPPDGFTIAARLSNGGLNKTGSATLNLSAANTYLGTTTVSGGKLNITGSLANSAVTVNSAAGFGGTGSVAGPVTVAAGGNLDLVDGAINSFSLGSSLNMSDVGGVSNFNLELNTLAGITTFDSANAAGALSVNPTGVIVNLTNLGAAPSDGTYTILSYNPIGSTLNPLFTFSNLSTTETIGGKTVNLVNIAGAEQIVIGAFGPPTSTWTAAVDTSWNTSSGATNWSPSGVLNAVGAVANFTSTGAGTVTLDGSKTVGKVNISSAVAYSLTQGSGGTLTIDDHLAAVPNPSINVTAGSHAISAPIGMFNGLNINLSNSTALSINNTITGTGPVAVTGGGTLSIGTAGQLNATSSLTLTGNAKVALTPVAAPSTPNAQTVASLSIDGTSQLDIGNNKLTISTATVSAIRSLIISGYNGGAWTGTTGITSTTAQADLKHGVGYNDNGAGGVITRYTIYGDTTLDGTVNFQDLVALAQNYTSTTAVWATGDFNYDGITNFIDLVALAQNYTATLTPGEGGLAPSFVSDWNLAQSEVAAVPEPTSLGLLAIGATGLLARRRRRSAN